MKDSIVQCELCPKACKLAHKQRGDCRVRINYNGKLVSLIYGKPCAVHVDPIEKKPLFHFLPGTGAFSIATAGCNLHCKFCQNWEISQTNPEDAVNATLMPADVVSRAVYAKCRSIAYTYAEPVIFYEYVYDTAVIAYENNIKNLMISAGYINEKPLRSLCKYVDAANIDLKGFTKEYYRDICYARLQPTLDALEIINEEGVLLEITNLVVPTLNDDMKLIEKMCLWIKDSLGEDTPLHFSRFYPMFKLKSLYPTPVETLKTARKVAQDAGLHYIYIGNVPGSNGEDTICPQCKKVVVNRVGYSIIENYIVDGKCKFCSYKIHGVWR